MERGTKHFSENPGRIIIFVSCGLELPSRSYTTFPAIPYTRTAVNGGGDAESKINLEGQQNGTIGFSFEKEKKLLEFGIGNRMEDGK